MFKRGFANQTARDDMRNRRFGSVFDKKAQQSTNSNMTLANKLNEAKLQATESDDPGGHWESFEGDGVVQVEKPSYIKRIYLAAHPEGAKRGGYGIWVEGVNGEKAYWYDDANGGLGMWG